MSKPLRARNGTAPPVQRRERSGPPARPDMATTRLTGHAPLVPVQSAASRALVGVIAILTFLAALCAGAAELIASNSAEWASSVSREATIQVRPIPQRDIEADMALVAELARRTPGVASVTVLGKADSERLLEPWLGRGLDMADLPVPRLAILRFEEGARPDFAELRRRLAAEVPGAGLDDHGAWLARLSVMANTIVFVGIALTVLVLVATALAVAFATHGAMAGNREVVEVLHFVGADDAYIAREFQRRFFRLGLKGSFVGGAVGLAAITALSLASAAWRASPAGDQIEAMFGGFDIGWRGYGAIGLIALLVSALTAVVSRLTVKHFLSRSP
jgi:cell division transport system permease protein